MSYSISLYHGNRCPQPANSIVINASGVALNGAIASSFYARPLRVPYRQLHLNYLTLQVV